MNLFAINCSQTLTHSQGANQIKDNQRFCIKQTPFAHFAEPAHSSLCSFTITHSLTFNPSVAAFVRCNVLSIL